MLARLPVHRSISDQSVPEFSSRVSCVPPCCDVHVDRKRVSSDSRGRIRGCIRLQPFRISFNSIFINKLRINFRFQSQYSLITRNLPVQAFDASPYTGGCMGSSGKNRPSSSEQVESYHEHSAFEPIVHKSDVMKRVCSMTFRYARTDMPVLITGETGTGKELIARAVHAASNRADQPFVIVDCAALPETLMGNELFGHERGAYTGADRKQPGLFAAANKGTIFLDEIGELPLSAQAVLLRVLQDGSYRPYGSVRQMNTDIRVIAATNRDLKEAVVQKSFRLDLYHRMGSAVLQMPPLRSRTADIPLLIRHFMRKLASPGSQPLEISPTVTSRLLHHRWEGNVRELENRLRSAIALVSNGQITVEDLFPEEVEGTDRSNEIPSLRTVRTGMSKDTEGQYLENILRETNGNVSKAAEIVGVHRTHLYKLLRSHGISPSQYR